MGIKKYSPELYEEAKRLHASGVSYDEIIRRLGIPRSSINYVIFQEIYVIRDSPTKWRALGFTTKPSIKAIRAALEAQKDQNNSSPEFPSNEKVIEGASVEKEVEKAEAMSDRTFIPVRVIQNGVPRSGVKIECSKRTAPDCEKGKEFFNSRGRVSDIHAAQVFRNAGWNVGGGPRNDICGKCMAFMKGKHPSQQEETQVKNVIAIERVGNVAVRTVKKTGAATQEDKRVIFGKLDEVYSAEKGGYINDWNDQKVSDDLGCPKEWVVAVRDNLFGPETSANDFHKDVERLQQFSASIVDLKKQISTLVENMERLDGLFNDKLTKFERDAKEFQRRYDELMKIKT